MGARDCVLPDAQNYGAAIPPGSPRFPGRPPRLPTGGPASGTPVPPENTLCGLSIHPCRVFLRRNCCTSFRLSRLLRCSRICASCSSTCATRPSRVRNSSSPRRLRPSSRRPSVASGCRRYSSPSRFFFFLNFPPFPIQHSHGRLFCHWPSSTACPSSRWPALRSRRLPSCRASSPTCKPTRSNRCPLHPPTLPYSTCGPSSCVWPPAEAKPSSAYKRPSRCGLRTYLLWYSSVFFLVSSKTYRE